MKRSKYENTISNSYTNVSLKLCRGHHYSTVLRTQCQATYAKPYRTVNVQLSRLITKAVKLGFQRSVKHSVQAQDHALLQVKDNQMTYPVPE
jgi:hypothetical protein